jgi:hypothetical protein
MLLVAAAIAVGAGVLAAVFLISALSVRRGRVFASARQEVQAAWG